MTGLTTSPVKLPDSSNDLELISALMSMRNGSQTSHWIKPTKKDQTHQKHRSLKPSTNFPLPSISTSSCSSSSSLSSASTANSIPVTTDNTKPITSPLASSTLAFQQTATSFATLSQRLPQAYSPYERKQALQRYRDKKQRRKTAAGSIRYQIRKKLADCRPRYRGRFSKPKQSARTPFQKT